MSEEYQSDWLFDYTTILGYCITWEVCNCGQTTLMYWPNGKEAGIFGGCLVCGDDTFTICFLASEN
jgi:hypothetical protein